MSKPAAHYQTTLPSAEPEKAPRIVEVPEECTKPIWEPCRLHPVDCENCQHGDGCNMRDIAMANPDKIKRCRFFRPRQEVSLP